MKYVPRDCCQICQKATEPVGVLRRLADVGEKDENVEMVYKCTCGNMWSCNYLASALGADWTSLTGGTE